MKSQAYDTFRTKAEARSFTCTARDCEPRTKFSGFCEKTAKARSKATDAVTAARYAKSAIAAFDDKEVFARAKQAGRRAARLHKKMSREPAAVGESSVGTSFASLTSEADELIPDAQQRGLLC